MSARLTYVFCLVRSARRPVLRGGPVDRPGGSGLRLLDVDASTRLVVTSVPAAEYSEAALAAGLQNLDWVGRRAMAHEAVIERFLSATAVLPMQLFTLFMSDERALEHVRKDRRQIERILKRIERQHEWGLRLTWDEKAARDGVEHAHRAPGRRGVARDGASGTAYLSRKRDLLDVGRVQLAGAKAEATRLYRALAGASTDAVRRTNLEKAAPGSRLLLDAAFLVPVKKGNAFRGVLRKQSQTLASSGIVVSLTGPWPPYNFI